MNRMPIILAALIPVLLLATPNVFASHNYHHVCVYPENGSGSIFEHGLDDGTIMAQRGDAAPNYDDCIGDGGIMSYSICLQIFDILPYRLCCLFSHLEGSFDNPVTYFTIV